MFFSLLLPSIFICAPRPLHSVWCTSDLHTPRCGWHSAHQMIFPQDLWFPAKVVLRGFYIGRGLGFGPSLGGRHPRRCRGVGARCSVGGGVLRGGTLRGGGGARRSGVGFGVLGGGVLRGGTLRGGARGGGWCAALGGCAGGGWWRVAPRGSGVPAFHGELLAS